MRHDHIGISLDENDGPLRCTCTHTAGDSYYCRIHGGNGSWISLLRALVDEAEDGRTDETTCRALRAAARRLPDGHPLRARAETVIGAAADDGSTPGAERLRARTRAVHRAACAMKDRVHEVEAAHPHAHHGYLMDALLMACHGLEMMADRLAQMYPGDRRARHK